MTDDNASDAEAPALFCLELYVHRIERLPRRLRDKPPALALRFLDYDAVVVEPPQGAKGNPRGACWYGAGKRCVFEARESELATKLQQRRDTAVLCHAVEANAPVRRKLYGSSSLALPTFGDDNEDEAPLGAVRTWGRAECRCLLENAHGRVVGAATVSISLASLDASLRKCLGHAPLNQLRLSVDLPVGDALRPKSIDVSPHAVRQSGAGQLELAWSTRSEELAMPPSTETASPPSVQQTTEAFASPPGVAETTLVFAGAMVATFDGKARTALIAALARQAGVAPERVTITGCRAGSLVVDCRIDFEEAADAQSFAEDLVKAPPVDLAPALGACGVVKAVAGAPEYVEAYGEVAAGPDVAPVVKAPPPVSPPAQPTYPYRSLDVFRGEAVLVDDEDLVVLGDCPQPFYYATSAEPPPEVFVPPETVILPPPPSPQRPRGDPWLTHAVAMRHDPGVAGVIFDAVPDPAAPPPPPPPSPPRAVLRPKPNSRLLPRGHTLFAAELRGDRRARRPRTAPLRAANRAKRVAPPPRVARLAAKAPPLPVKKRSKPRVQRAPLPAPPPPPLSPEKEEALAAAFERVRSADGRASLGDLRVSRGGGPGGEKRVTFGEYLFRVAEGDVAVC